MNAQTVPLNKKPTLTFPQGQTQSDGTPALTSWFPSNMLSENIGSSATLASVKDYVEETLEEYVNGKLTSNASKIVVGLLSVTMCILLYIAICIKISLVTTSDSLKVFSETISKTPLLSKLGTYLEKVPTQVLYLVLWVFAILTNLLHPYVARTIYTISGVTMIWDASTQECKRYFMITTGLIQLSYVLSKFEPLSNWVGSTAFAYIFKYVTFAAAGFIVSDVIFGNNICEYKAYNRGQGNMSALIDDKHEQ